MFGCGENTLGETGTSLVKKYILEPKPTGLKNVVMIQAGKVSAALTNNGELYVWGGNLNRSAPYKVPFEEGNIMDMRAGSEKIYCLSSNG